MVASSGLPAEELRRVIEEHIILPTIKRRRVGTIWTTSPDPEYALSAHCPVDPASLRDT